MALKALTATGRAPALAGPAHDDEYYRTHAATTPQEAAEKRAAYDRANANGVKGYPYLSQDELKLLGGVDQRTVAPGVQVWSGSPADIKAVAAGGSPAAVAPPVYGGLSTPIAGGSWGGQPSAVAPGAGYTPPGTAPTAGGVAPGSVGAAGGGGVAGAPAPGSSSATLDKLVEVARQGKNENVGFNDNVLQPSLENATRANQVLLAGQQAQDDLYAGQLAGLYTQQDANAQAANAQSYGALMAYGSGLSAADQNNRALYGNLANTYAGMSQLDPTHQVANQQAAMAALSQAGLAQSDYQRAGLTNADFRETTAAQADFARAALQQSSYRNADQQTAGYTNAFQQTADSNPEDRANQLAALQRYEQLSASPEATAQERFLYETQRTNQEQQEKASRDALMNDYRVRGMGGSGMELTSLLAAGQQNSQQRLLGDLGTQAGAVQRQMQALQGQAALSSTMRGQGAQESQFNAAQGNDISKFNANAYNEHEQFNADQGNRIGMFNADAYNTSSRANADQFNQNQQFNAAGWNQNAQFNAAAMSHQNDFNANAYNTTALNNAGWANQNSQFNANAFNNNSQFNAGQANAVGIANAGFANQNSQYNAGQTNMVNMNNLNQNMAQGQFEDNYRASQQQQAAGRALDLTNTGMTVNRDYTTNLGNYSTQFQGGVRDAYGRLKDTTEFGAKAGTQINNARRLTTTTGIGINDADAERQLERARQRGIAVTSGTAGIIGTGTAVAGSQAAGEAVATINGGKKPFDPLDWNTW
jgi:hypothetical protein